MKGFYSQNGEDFLLDHLFDGKINGYFIDVGAFDGIHLSNTFYLEQQGWKGICVEPIPEYYGICKQNRVNSICLNTVCIGQSDLEYVLFFEDDLGLLSRIQSNFMIDVPDRYKARSLEFTGFKKYILEATTLNNILEEYLIDEKIDVISIDVEGAELDVLQGLDLNKYQPRVLVVEANSPQAEQALIEHFEKHNYLFGRRLNENLIFVKDWMDRIKLKSIRVNCILEKQLHPKGEKFTTSESRETRKIIEPLRVQHIIYKVIYRVVSLLRIPVTESILRYG